MENLKGVKGPVIFACNHSSETDPLFVPAALPFFSPLSPIFYTSREKTFYQRSGWRRAFYGGTFFKAWGAYPVFTGLKDYDSALKHHKEIIRAGGSLCVFPEGRITRDGNIQPAKGGVAYLSYVTGAPIVPVRIRGSYGLKLKDFILGRARFSISFGRRMYVGQMASMLVEDYKMHANRVMEEVGKM